MVSRVVCRAPCQAWCRYLHPKMAPPELSVFALYGDTHKSGPSRKSICDANDLLPCVMFPLPPNAGHMVLGPTSLHFTGRDIHQPHILVAARDCCLRFICRAAECHHDGSFSPTVKALPSPAPIVPRHTQHLAMSFSCMQVIACLFTAALISGDICQQACNGTTIGVCLHATLHSRADTA